MSTRFGRHLDPSPTVLGQTELEAPSSRVPTSGSHMCSPPLASTFHGLHEIEVRLSAHSRRASNTEFRR